MCYKWIWNSNKQRKWSAEWTKSVLVCPGLFHRWLSPDLDSHVAELWLVNTSIFFSQKLFPVWSSVWRVGNDRNQPSGALKIRVFSDETRDECHREIKHFSVCVNEKKKSQEFHTWKKKISWKKIVFIQFHTVDMGKKLWWSKMLPSVSQMQPTQSVSQEQKRILETVYFFQRLFFSMCEPINFYLFFLNQDKNQIEFFFLEKLFFFSGKRNCGKCFRFFKREKIKKKKSVKKSVGKKKSFETNINTVHNKLLSQATVWWERAVKTVVDSFGELWFNVQREGSVTSSGDGANYNQLNTPPRFTSLHLCSRCLDRLFWASVETRCCDMADPVEEDLLRLHRWKVHSQAANTATLSGD